MNHKRIILCGPTASGKTFIRDKFRKKGYNASISYTSRLPRKDEKEGVDYHFIGDEFPYQISQNKFYEYTQYGNNWYGTGQYEWDNCDIFIMETDGVNFISPEERKNCLVIFVNTPIETRLKRMKERGWDDEKIYKYIEEDKLKFKNFNFDLEIIS